jgi:hypothetical protein
MAVRATGNPPPGQQALQLDLRETRQLWWWFQNGSVMAPWIRGRLRRAWGLCQRHTWAHLAVECELRWRPYSTAGLYLDLTERAAAALTEPPGRGSGGPVVRLRARDSCVVCESLTGSTAGPDPSFQPRRQRFNRLLETRARLAATRPLWAPASCPRCGGGRGFVCRPHLLAGEPERAGAPSADAVDPATYAVALGELRGRLERLVTSMTLHGPAATPEVEAALVGAVGWFAGFQIAHWLAPSGA